jgi:hypothetical protein
MSSQFDTRQLEETTAQINNLLQRSNNQLTCGPDCQSQQKASQLQQAYIDAKNNMLSAPYQLKEAQKNYISYTEGDASYNTLIKNEFTTEAENQKKIMQTEFYKAVQNANAENNIYESLYENYNNITELLKKYTSDNIILSKKLEQNKDDTITNDRKIYYENQQYQIILGRYTILKWIYIILVIVFAALLFIKNTSYSITVKIFLIIIFIAYPFIINHIILYIINSLKHLYNMLPASIYNKM